MIFFLRKFIEALLVPIGLSGLIILTGILLRRRWLALTGVAVLFIFSSSFTADLLMRPLERVYPPMTVAAAPNADAIVVLSGNNVRGMNEVGLQFGETANRYFGGLDLAAAGKAPHIVFTSGDTDDPKSRNQALLLRQDALRHGLEPDRIIITPRVLTTDDEARAVAQIPGVHSVLLVTSATHMPRAALLFRRRGLTVFPFPTDQRTWGAHHSFPGAFIPTGPELRNSEAAMREYYGLAVYRLLFAF